jgi:hypothetical protein
LLWFRITRAVVSCRLRVVSLLVRFGFGAEGGEDGGVLVVVGVGGVVDVDALMACEGFE